MTPQDAHRSRLTIGLTIGAAIVAALLCLALFVHLSQLYPKTSDQANFFLAGVDITHGNWRLKNWVLPPDNYWTSDVALSALLSMGWAILGRPPQSPFLLILQPALVWTLIIITVLAMAWCRLPSWRSRLGAAVIALSVLFMPLTTITMMYFITLSAIHLGSVLYCLATFHIVDRSLVRSSASPVTLVAACAIVICLGVISDPLLIFVTVMPVLLTCAMLVGTPWSNRVAIAVATVVGTISAGLLLNLNTATGGFKTQILPMEFVRFDDLPKTLWVAMHCLLQLFSADFFGLALRRAAAQILHLPLLMIALAAMVVPLRFLWRRWRQDDAPAISPLLVLLAFGALLNLLAVAFSNRIMIEDGSIATSRYLFPLWICLTLGAAILFARNKVLVVLALLAMISAAHANWPFYRGKAVGILYPPQDVLLSFLLDHDLVSGIGPYWESTNLQLASLGRVVIYPGVADPTGKIIPYLDWRKAFSFADLQGPRFFVIISDTHPQIYTAKDVVQTFGPPEAAYQVWIYHVYVYRHAATE